MGTAAYPVALRRASRIGAWMLRFKAAQTSEEALKEVPITVKCRIGIDEQDPEQALFAFATARGANGY